MAAPITATFDREKSTKNTVRFKERDGDEPVRIGTLYIQKATAAALGDPETITVTVAAGEQT